MPTTLAPHDTATLTIPSPIGPITLHAGPDALTRVEIGSAADGGQAPSAAGVHPVLSLAAAQLDEYFAGVRQDFDLPIELRGTEFQLQVWQALGAIPYGQTLSYGELAEQVGRPGAARAIGGAVGANPLPIVIPCHRVMGKDGSITGYSGGDGVSTKRRLLDLEHSAAAR